jgi:hypothetical protein
MKNTGRLTLFMLLLALTLVAPLTASARPHFRAPYAQGPSFFAPDSEGVITTGPRLVVASSRTAASRLSAARSRSISCASAAILG